MGQTDIDSYHHLFIKSAKNCLITLKNNFALYITSLPKFDPFVVSEMFRMAHMLKGQAAAMGYKNTAHYCLTLQRVFEEIQEKKLILNSKQLFKIQQAINILNQNLLNIEQQKKEIDFSQLNNLQNFFYENTNR